MSRCLCRPIHRSARILLALLIVLTLLQGGCKVGYVFQQAGGQIRILAHRRPIPEVLAEAATTPEARQKLGWIADMKRFAEERVGLAQTDNYTTYYDTGGAPVAFSLVACPADSLAPVTWWFPFVGSVSYLGYFDREDAIECLQEYQADGFDTYLGTVAAYSTLGWFSDPVFSPMLENSEGELANLIVHETTHATVYFGGRSEFNETLAEFVGNHGEIQYLTERYGADSPEVRSSRERFEDTRRFNDWIASLARKLKAVYAQEQPVAWKLAEKRRILAAAGPEYQNLCGQLHGDDYRGLDPGRLNNAMIAAFETYHSDTQVFDDLFEALGRDLRALVDFFRRVPAGQAPLDYARSWLAMTPGQRLDQERLRQEQRRQRRPGRGS